MPVERALGIDCVVVASRARLRGDVTAAIKTDGRGWERVAMSSLARQMVVIGLLLSAVGGLFVAAQSGQQRLENASRRVELAAQRERALSDVLQLLQQAESSQRGYILVGNPDYLVPFQEASGRITAAQARLAAAFSTAAAPSRGDIGQIERLCDAKFTEMRQTIEVFRTRGRAAAVQLIRTDVGVQTMTQIEDLARKIQAEQTSEVLEASRSWRISRWVSLATTSTALAASLGLVLLLMRLGLRHMRSRDREAQELGERQAELERLVTMRTEELSELSTHLQSMAEQEKSALSRELHDELGGLLVAARMDVSWLEDRLSTNDPEVRSYFKRVHETLQAGVDVKRRVVENLRPTLLDNLGLFPALRWQVADGCGRAGLKCIERYPDAELLLTPEASITVFRIVQEALTNVLKHARARSVEISIETDAQWLLVRIRDDGVGLPQRRLTPLRSHGLAAMRHRAAGLGGQCEVHRPLGGGTEVELRLPLERVLAEAPEAPEAPALTSGA
jgi:signal transduction histidine kinase